jgi:hypothetical protein
MISQSDSLAPVALKQRITDTKIFNDTAKTQRAQSKRITKAQRHKVTKGVVFYLLKPLRTLRLCGEKHIYLKFVIICLRAVHGEKREGS